MDKGNIDVIIKNYMCFDLYLMDIKSDIENIANYHKTLINNSENKDNFQNPADILPFIFDLYDKIENQQKQIDYLNDLNKKIYLSLIKFYKTKPNKKGGKTDCNQRFQKKQLDFL